MKATREQVVALAKELNSLLDLKISTTAATKTEIIMAQIESNIPQLTSADFAEDRAEDEGLSNAAIETYKLLGFKVPKKAEKKAADVVKGKEQKKVDKKEKKTTETGPKTIDLLISAIREKCKKGATMDELMIGGSISRIPFAVKCLVAFNILEVKDGVYKLVK